MSWQRKYIRSTKMEDDDIYVEMIPNTLSVCVSFHKERRKIDVESHVDEKPLFADKNPFHEEQIP